VGRVVVIGATFVDMCFAQIEPPTEVDPTSTAADAVTCLGGKGYNQAVAAKRMNADVCLITAVGKGDDEDPMSPEVKSRLVQHERFQKDDVVVFNDERVKLAPVAIMSNGNDIRMLSTPREQWPMLPSNAFSEERVLSQLAAANVILMTFDFGRGALEALLDEVQRLGTDAPTLLLNPAPDFQRRCFVPGDLLRKIHWLVPNRREARLLLGEDERPPVPAHEFEYDRALAAYDSRIAGELSETTRHNVVVTLGRHGCRYAGPLDGTFPDPRVPGHSTVPADTTAASDAFCGALAACLARGMAAADAVRFANAAGAVACERLGTSVSMPTWDQVVAMLPPD
jgi:ribokinase